MNLRFCKSWKILHLGLAWLLWGVGELAAQPKILFIGNSFTLGSADAADRAAASGGVLHVRRDDQVPIEAHPLPGVFFFLGQSNRCQSQLDIQ